MDAGDAGRRPELVAELRHQRERARTLRRQSLRARLTASLISLDSEQAVLCSQVERHLRQATGSPAPRR